MDLEFQKQDIACLRCGLCQVQNLEQTQEVRLSEGMPGISRIVGSWGQAILRSKEWQRDRIVVSGGVMAWLLYEPEDGSGLKCLDTWIPFKLDWDLSSDLPTGMIRVRPLLRSVDARLVSAGKTMIRVGLAVSAECWSEQAMEYWKPGEVPADVELLRTSWPVQLPKEAGEKPFELEEELTLPPSIPSVEQILYYQMEPEITDQKLLGSKIIFRGSGNLHILYRCEDGMLHSWDFEVPFSQYDELQDSHSPDAQADVMMALTRLELENDGEGRLHLKAGLTGQYLVNDREILEVVEDAYSPHRELEVTRTSLSVPALLDNRRETIYGEVSLPIQADVVTDAAFLPGFPRQRREGDTMFLEHSGMLQLLYYDQEGRIQASNHRWDGVHSLKADENAQITVQPHGTKPQVTQLGDSLTLRMEVPVQLTASTGQGMTMLTGFQLGQTTLLDPRRPSLVLRRAGKDRLWDLARESGSTIAAIREANGLEGEPEANRMLLIPVI